MNQINGKVGHKNKCLTFAKNIIHNVPTWAEKTKSSLKCWCDPDYDEH